MGRWIIGKNIASLQAQVGASLGGFTSGMQKMEADAKARTRAVNNLKPVLKVEANTALAKKQIGGLQKSIAMKPLTLGMAVAGGALMRAITQTEEGKKFIENIDRITSSVLSPFLQALNPLMADLVPVMANVGATIGRLTHALDRLPSLIPGGSSAASGPDAGWVPGWVYTVAPMLAGIADLERASTGAPVAANTAAMNNLASVFRAIMPGLFASSGGPQANPAFNPTARQSPTGWLAQLQAMSSGVQSNIAGIQGGPQAGQLAAIQSQFQADITNNQAKVEELTAALAAARAAGWGVAAAETRLAEATDALARSHALYGAELAKAQAAMGALSRAQRIAAMHADSTALNLAGRSPLQVFQEEMDRLTNLRDMPGSTLNTAGFNTAAAAAFNQLQSTLPQAPTSGPGFLQAGSVEAQAAINAFNRQGGRGTVQEQMLAVMTAARRDEAATAAGVTEMARAIGRGTHIAPATRVPRA